MNSICQKLIDPKGGLNWLLSNANNINAVTAVMIEIRKCLILNRSLFMCLSLTNIVCQTKGCYFSTLIKTWFPTRGIKSLICCCALIKGRLTLVKQG